jgi:geranylgeranyldiphosphate transferase
MLGQDDSLVWRRDGFGAHPDVSSALSAYQACASLKTGALFRLVGQLVTGTHEMDDIMSDFGYVIPTITARLDIHR